MGNNLFILEDDACFTTILGENVLNYYREEHISTKNKDKLPFSVPSLPELVKEFTEITEKLLKRRFEANQEALKTAELSFAVELEAINSVLDLNEFAFRFLATIEGEKTNFVPFNEVKNCFAKSTFYFKNTLKKEFIRQAYNFSKKYSEFESAAWLSSQICLCVFQLKAEEEANIDKLELLF